jgi:C-terminal processing protease CtpA/Prc
MKLVIICLSILSLIGVAHAENEGKRGFVLNVEVSGFFSPEVKSAEVKSLVTYSNAEKAGIKVGDELIAVHECKIPGCPAKKAKKLMTKNAGEIVSLSFRRTDGTNYSVELVLE